MKEKNLFRYGVYARMMASGDEVVVVVCIAGNDYDRLAGRDGITDAVCLEIELNPLKVESFGKLFHYLCQGCHG